MRQHLGYQSIKQPRRHTQRGVMLLEVLISVLLFALGLIALIGVQAKSATLTGDAQYRIEAVRYANAYVAKMWTYQGGTYDAFETAFKEDGSEYKKFKDSIMLQGSGIPNAQPPAVQITASSSSVTLADGRTAVLPQANVTITITWVDKDNHTHNYLHETSIGFKPVVS
ncbi:MAG: hypothetical protein LBG61_01710 [Burkholderiales bacterium]|jgi:type IV pilus assembly protein PilV|nr:hypothetical protein [Burkholderiales bacterium]